MSTQKKAVKTFHLIANAHLDPVWLWDWREGLNEGISTSRAILDLMDEMEELTCVRGEMAVYRHVEKHDPETFARIKRQVAAGRWDVVGGTYVQPDMNMTGTETLARHFLRAKRYFRSRFGKDVTVAWAADAFGHSAGLPEILAGAGVKGFAFSRPTFAQLPLSKPAFWWVGSGGSKVMGYRPLVGYYGCDRYDSMHERLDAFLEAALRSDIDNVGVYYGLGDHGGGPTRRLVEEIRQWAGRHPELRVVHSGLHRLFKSLYAEAAAKGEAFLPTHRGELNFCQRGCYASAAKFKFAFRKAEALACRGERADTAVSAYLGQAPADLDSIWDSLLFNSFHDILPGTSIERAYDDQLAWLGKTVHECQEVELTALNALADKVDTSVPRPPDDRPTAVPFLVWNPHPHAYHGPLELEACLDYRPIMAYTGRPDELPVELRGPDGDSLPFQVVATEHASFPELAWRKRVVADVALPPLGWSVFTLAWQEGAERPRTPNPATAQGDAIDNGTYRVTAAKGAAGVQVFHEGRAVFGGQGLSLVTVEDPWGSWGGELDQPESLNLSEVRCRWEVGDVIVLERGPERAALWVRMTGGRSHLDFTFSVSRGRPAVDVAARLLWNERSARLKLVMPVGSARAEFEVPGGVVQRQPACEVPGGRWVRMEGFGFASDALYGFDCKDGALRATIVRASRYADGRTLGPLEEPWRPALDCGELKFRFVLAPGDARLPRLAGELEQPPVALPVPARKASLPRSGSLAELPESLQLLALKPAQDGKGWILRAQEAAGEHVQAWVVWLGERVELGELGPRRIATWRLQRSSGRWRATPAMLTERGCEP